MANLAGVFREDEFDVFLKVVKKAGVENDAVFDDFGETTLELAGREVVEGGGVDPDAYRLVKRADDIFAARMIDADLAADGAIDLGEKGRGNHEKRETASVGCGHEAGEVADDASSEGEDRCMAVGSKFDELVIEVDGAVERF